MIELGKISVESKERGNRVYFTVPKEMLTDALEVVKGMGCRLSTITGADLGSHLEILYHFSLKEKIISLRVILGKECPEIHTITGHFPAAILYERELMDLLGIKVIDHPDPRRLILPEEMEGKHPLRR